MFSSMFQPHAGPVPDLGWSVQLGPAARMWPHSTRAWVLRGNGRWRRSCWRATCQQGPRGIVVTAGQIVGLLGKKDWLMIWTSFIMSFNHEFHHEFHQVSLNLWNIWEKARPTVGPTGKSKQVFCFPLIHLQCFIAPWRWLRHKAWTPGDFVAQLWHTLRWSTAAGRAVSGSGPWKFGIRWRSRFGIRWCAC